MNHETLSKRLKAATKSPTVRRLVLDLAEVGAVRTCWTTGRGRWTSNTDRTAETIAAAKACGLTVTLSNDAPKGSPTGNLLTLDAPGRRKVAAIRTAWMERRAQERKAEEERRAQERKAEEERRARAAADAAERRAREQAALAAWDPAGAEGDALLIRWGCHAQQHNVSIRIAPAEVREAKDRLNRSWNDMKRLRAPYMPKSPNEGALMSR